MSTHLLTVEANNPDGVLFVCPEESCGRRVVVHRAGGITVIDRGDFYARHVGGTSPIDMGVELAG